MTGAALMAFLHHAAAFALVAMLAAELVLVRGELTVARARQLLRADAIFGISAGVVLAVGALRVGWFEKGASYYFHNVPFIAKLSLFVAVGLLSIYPTVQFLSWRAALKQGQAPQVPEHKLRAIRRVIHWELAGVLLIVLCAALMARGVGFVAPVRAALPAPEGVAKKVAAEMLALARHGMTEAAIARLAPEFDFARMTPLVVGPAWERATPSQRVQLNGEFQRVALRTYAGLLASTPDVALEFGPPRKPAADETELAVHAQLRRSDDKVEIDYLLERTEEGWKIYDLRVDGASLASTWRSEFAAQVRERGIDGLIEALAARNRRAAAAAL